MRRPLTLTVLGGAGEIGANSHHLDLGGTGILLDAGLHPRHQGVESLPDLDAVPGEVQAILITHAHLDHVGALPVALKRFPRARAYMTGPTSLLGVRMLRNAVAVARFKSPRKSRPLYTHEDVEWVEQVLQTTEYERPLWLEGKERPRITFFNAGHLLGAAGILVEFDGRRLFYTGDTCESAQFICKAAEYPVGPVDLLLMDSTHGADPDPNLTRDRRAFRQSISGLAQFITRVASRGGSVLIPVFAMGRTQEILGILASLIQRGHIPPLPIHISGLAHAICRIYDATRRDSVRQQPDLRLGELGVKVLHPDRLGDPALLKKPRILAASSGMMFPGTGSHTLAGQMLARPEHGVAFVGYVDPATPGQRLITAEPGQTVVLGGEVGPQPLACEVQQFSFTAHSRASQLIHTVERLRPARVVLVHGDPGAVTSLQKQLEDLPSEVTVAEPGARIRF